jgi:formylglycine-generating enzyme required for sulfatase activity
MALPPGPYLCPAPPAFVTISAGARSWQMFTYEASHPLATAAAAFPGAVSTGPDHPAPAAPAEACARAGVRPWHTVTWAEADAACARIGWRLCTGDELRRACEGPEGHAYTWGDVFDGTACNLREAFTDAAGTTSEAPSGRFPRCVSAEGAFDLSGNLWEWIAAEGGDERTYQGAGWRIIPERHRDSDLTCAATTRLTGGDAATYAHPDVGFRCCRDVR